MKRAITVILGCLAGAISAIAVIYISGFLLSQFDVQLYASEFDQQRNFNIAMIILGLGSLLGGVFAYRRRA